MQVKEPKKIKSCKYSTCCYQHVEDSCKCRLLSAILGMADVA